MRLRYHTAVICIALAFMVNNTLAQAEPISFEREVAPLLEKRCNECHHLGETSGGLDLTQLSTMLRGGDDLGPAIVPSKPDESPIIHVLHKGSEYLMPKDRDPLSKDEISLLKQWIAEGAVDDTPTFAIDDITFFESEVRPILLERCLKCHAGEDAESGLQLTSRHGTLIGGDRGPAAVPGDPSSSLLITAVKHAGKLKMPRGGDRLTDEQVAALETWIKKGLPWPSNNRVLAREKLFTVSDVDRNHWAFQPLTTPVLPHPAMEDGQAAHPIDHFIDAKLSELGLTANGPASRRVLIRRATFDLIGLPPTPGETAAFVNDAAPQDEAFAKVVERLLASEHYGERWGRHWLDLARYADTSGDAADAPIPEAHLYRDYVINSFNEDLPYDAFLVEQIAGDLLLKREPQTRSRERIIATGYIALARRYSNVAYRDMHLIVDNTLDTIGGGVLGMSLGCARCHDHKFDGITSKEYYGLAGYFHSTQYPHAGTEKQPQRMNFVELKGGGIAYAVTDKKNTSEIGDTRVHIQGEPKDLGELAVRGFLPAITPKVAKADIPVGESGRLQLARWIASADNPLTARVMANRIWQYHFGVGIVSTSNFFGMQGKPPSHPELLDWLAKRFIDEGWSVKQMHRLIMSSSTYQRSSKVNETLLRGDPDNHLLGSYRHRRLEAEPMRDAVLAVSGLLDRGNPGPHDFPKPNAKNEYPYTQHSPFFMDYNHNHRTVYLPARRLGKHSYMANFNGPDTNVCTANRSVSTVPLQSLFWMNSDFIQENSAAFAARLERLEAEPDKRIKLAYQLALNRAPQESEVAEAMNYLKDYAAKITDEGEAVGMTRAWTSFCRVLYASNEFIYVQ
ncbi:MAG: hypothetical protein COA78_29270 [Blastopirellula sp.]|nr:MAG: hypothetical protein COA78_29270 [Blastopirellula sp.]